MEKYGFNTPSEKALYTAGMTIVVLGVCVMAGQIVLIAIKWPKFLACIALLFSPTLVVYIIAKFRERRAAVSEQIVILQGGRRDGTGRQQYPLCVMCNRPLKPEDESTLWKGAHEWCDYLGSD